MIIREAILTDAPGIARVHVDTWRSTYRGIVPDEFLANLSYEARERMWTTAITHASDSNFPYVAEDEQGQIVGFVSGGTSQSGDPNYAGELYAIYVLKEAQGKGVGRGLFGAVVDRLARSGIHTMIVWVFRDNEPSRRFYEAMGGELLYEKEFELGGARLTEVAYGWKETRVKEGNS
ncbi:MAG TPA: GNAT family N-acetyltransferase [Chloroflexia bacterium]|jgi:L-amino acid N-acyltransferase YncA